MDGYVGLLWPEARDFLICNSALMNASSSI